MGHTYQAVQWNRQKRVYDLVLWSGILLYLAVFVGGGIVLYPNITAETLLIRGFGTAAFVLLHVILIVGPLCRLDTRFLPMLYNRRHMGVSMFLLAAAHGIFSIIQFHSLGDMNPIVSIFVNDAAAPGSGLIPFQPLGFIALMILFVMAATSHDFWLAQLSAPVWKAIHMGVYAAYVLLVGHVAFGALQDETSLVPALVLFAGAAMVSGVHLAAGLKERKIDRSPERDDDYVDVASTDEIAEGRAITTLISGERVAIFNHDGQFCAVSNACQHQNGPLGEGRIIDGLITCPWHGYQYCPKTGRSPAPFSERVPVFDTHTANGRVFVSRVPRPPSDDKSDP